MVDYAHLQPATRPVAAEDAQSRIRRIRTDRWIGYARAEAVLAALEDLLWGLVNAKEFLLRR